MEDYTTHNINLDLMKFIEISSKNNVILMKKQELMKWLFASIKRKMFIEIFIEKLC